MILIVIADRNLSNDQDRDFVIPDRLMLYRDLRYNVGHGPTCYMTNNN